MQKRVQYDLDSVNRNVVQIMNELHQLQQQQQELRQGNQRVGPMDYDLQVRNQISMISNVFYNLLNSLGQKERD